MIECIEFVDGGDRVDTLLRMRLFVAVYEERSFTRAARRERATQSGVTQHVRQLEDQHDVSLFVRSPGSVKPTPAGDVYYRACVEVLRSHEQSRQAIRGYGRSLQGEVVVGLTPTMSREVLAPTLARFVDQHPNVVVRIVDAYSDIVTEKVRSGDVQFGVVPGFRPRIGMKSSFFVRTPEFLLSGPRSGLGLTHGQPVSLRTLGPLKVVMPTAAQARRQSLEAYIERTGVRIDRRLEIDTSLGTLDFVARTDWVSINPGISVMRAFEDGGLVVNPLVDPPLMLGLFLIERARQPLAAEAKAFLQVLHEEAARLEQDANARMGGILAPRTPPRRRRS